MAETNEPHRATQPEPSAAPVVASQIQPPIAPETTAIAIPANSSPVDPAAKPKSTSRPGPVLGWLKKYKIVLDWVAGTVFVGVTFAFAYLQYENAILQRALAWRQVQPTFSLSATYRKPAGQSTYDDLDVEINNVGGFALAARSTVTSWISASLFDPKALIKKRLLVPVDGYLNVSTGSGGNTTGVLSHYIGYNNNAKWVDLERAVRELAHAQGLFLEADLTTYAGVYYNDILGTPRRQYFQVEPINGGTEISEDKGRMLVENAYSSPNRVELSSLTPEQLLALIQQQPAEKN